MHRHASLVCLSLATVLAAVAVAWQAPRPGVTKSPQAVSAEAAGIGSNLPALSARDLAGQNVRFQPGSKGLVILFTGVDCPVCRKYGPTLARIEDEFKARGFRFIFINPAASEDPAEMRSAAKRLGLDGPYIHDKSRAVASGLGAVSTAEAFVYTGQGRLAYRGAVDDQYGIGFNTAKPDHPYLRDALAAVERGAAPKVQATTAPGCALAVVPAPTPEPITFHNRVAPILRKHCVSCHVPGGVAPFRLDTYEAAKDRASMIRYTVQQGIMPPWFARNYTPGHFSNDRSLPPAEKAALLEWIEKGSPEGKPTGPALPPAVAKEWQIGTPDAVFQMPRAIQVRAEGTMPYQNVTIPVGYDEDKWVQAIEVLPSARQVVHHILVFAVPRGGRSDAFDAFREQLDEISGFFGAYVPGNSALIYPEGFAKRLPKGHDLRFQIHYTPNGKAVGDQSKIGLVFAKQSPKHEVRTMGIANIRISIPPGADNHREVATLPVTEDAVLLSLLPHMHVRGKAAKYELVEAGGRRETLLDVPRYDFNWQLPYDLAEPRKLPKGSRIDFSVWYDNSDKNPANPDPTRTVRWGLQTYDEMHLGYIEYYLPNVKPGESSPGLRRGGIGAGLARDFVEPTFRRLDRDRDGLLTEEEAGAVLWRRLVRGDANRDGKISLEEAISVFGG